jgi:hypothetical protein
MIDDAINNVIKKMHANSHTETSEMGRFATSVLAYAEKSILTSFGVTK